MKAITLSMLLSALLVPSVGYARLGETIEQCVTRYGESDPTQSGEMSPGDGVVGDSLAVFKKAGFRITVVFLHGVVGSEMFTKMDETPMTEADKKLLLDAEAGGSIWKVTDETDLSGHHNNYIRADGNAYAEYIDGMQSMTIDSKTYHFAQLAKDDADQKDKLHGL